MAKTGPTFAPITPARRASGMSEVERFPEGSANTHTIGAPAILSGGYIDEAGANPTAVYGIFTTPGQNLAADGTANAFVDRLYPGKEYMGSLNATLTQAMIGSVVALVESASTWYFDTTTAVSASAQFAIKGPALGYAVGDSKPLVIVTALGDSIQNGN